MPELREIKKILVATGLTMESVGAVAMGKEIADRFGAELHAIHVIEPVSEAARQAIPGLAEAHMQQAEEELKLFADSHGLHDLVEKGGLLHVVRGSAEVEVLKAVRDLEADLLVIGRYGRGGLKRGRLGSIADRVIRKSPVSVLLAAPEYRGEMNTIAVSTGFSEECDLLVARAVNLARILGKSEVVILHAYHLPVGYHRVMSEEEATARLEELAIRRTDKLQQTVGTPAGVQLRLKAGRGDARTVIPNLAADAGVTMLVVGTHSRTLPAMFMLPRITEAIINNVHCSVWAARRPEWYQNFIKAIGEIIGA